MGFLQLMMMILGNLVAVWARTCRSMGEPYLRSLELLLVMMMMMVLLTNVSCHAFIGDIRFGGKQTIKGMDLEKTMMSVCSV